MHILLPKYVKSLEGSTIILPYYYNICWILLLPWEWCTFFSFSSKETKRIHIWNIRYLFVGRTMWNMKLFLSSNVYSFELQIFCKVYIQLSCIKQIVTSMFLSEIKRMFYIVINFYTNIFCHVITCQYHCLGMIDKVIIRISFIFISRF